MYTVKALIEALQQCPEYYVVMVNYDVHCWGDIEAVAIDHGEGVVELFTD